MQQLTCRQMFSSMFPQLQKLALNAIEKGFSRRNAVVILMDVEDPVWAEQAAKYQPDGPAQWAAVRKGGGKPLLWGWGQISELKALLAPHPGYARVVDELDTDPGEGVFHAIVFGEGGVTVLPLVHPDP